MERPEPPQTPEAPLGRKAIVCVSLGETVTQKCRSLGVAALVPGRNKQRLVVLNHTVSWTEDLFNIVLTAAEAAAENRPLALLLKSGSTLTELDWGVPVATLAGEAFSLQSGRNALQTLGVQERPFTDAAAVCAIGALVSYAARDSKVEIEDVETLDLGQFVHVSPDTLDALEIFRSETHPSAVGDARAPKEGFSLFALLDRANSDAGRLCVRRWLLRPLVNVAEISRRHDAVEFLFNVPHVELCNAIGSFKSVSLSLKRVCECAAGFHDWSKLRASLLALDRVVRALSDLAQTVAPQPLPELLCDVNESSVSACKSALSYFEKVFDWELCADQKELIVARGIDKQLDETRERLADLNSLCERAGVVCLRNLGFFVVSDEVDSSLGEAQFQLENDDGIPKAYYKNDETKRMDARFGDLHASVHELLASHVRNAETMVAMHAVAVSEADAWIAQIDALCSFATVSRELDYHRPQMSESPCSSLIAARHPLLELNVDRFVPNDILLDDSSRVRIVSGPNYSGKSVILKTAALAHVMAQAGCFVPCDPRSRIGVCDRLFTRVSNRRALAVHESSFSNDCVEMARIMRGATQRSLILVDEFGRGTRGEDGVALLGACLCAMGRDLKARALVSTHLPDELWDNFSELRSGVFSFSKMMVDAHESEEEVSPLFRMADGIACGSFGRACAKKAGVKARVLARMAEVRALLVSKKPVRVRTDLSNKHNIDLARVSKVVDSFLDGWTGDEEILAKLEELRESSRVVAPDVGN